MTRFDDFTEKISHIDFHKNNDKIRTIESLRNLLIVEYNNYLETCKTREIPIYGKMVKS